MSVPSGSPGHGASGPRESERSSRAERDAEDFALVERFQAGDMGAFERLYKQHIANVNGYLRVALRDHHDREEIAQQVFTKVYASLGRFERKDGIPFRAWLLWIARNEVLTELTRQQRRSVQLLAPGELRDEVDACASIASPAIHWAGDAELGRLVERLPIIWRQILVLRFVFEHSPSEVAQVIQSTPTAVRQNQRRALRHLKKRLEALGDAAPEVAPPTPL